MPVVINGIFTNYLRINPQGKKALIILPGWGQHSYHWSDISKKIDQSIQIIIIDLPGFGNSQPLKNNPNVPEYSQFLKDFIDKLNLNQPFLLGHSFGGQIAADFVIKYPKCINRLILISPAVIREQSFKTKIQISLTKISQPITKIFPSKITQKLLSLLTPTDYHNSNPYQKNLLKKIVKYDLKDKLHLIKTHTLIIWGSEDHEIPYQGKFLTETISSSNLEVIYGAGHSPHLSHIDKLVKIINCFLTTHH